MTVAPPSGTPNTSEIVSAVCEAANLVDGVYTYSTTSKPNFDLVKSLFFNEVHLVEHQIKAILEAGLKTCAWRGVRPDQGQSNSLTLAEALQRLDRAREIHNKFVTWLDSQANIAYLMEKTGMSPHFNEEEILFLRGRLARLDKTIEDAYFQVAHQETLHQAIRGLMAIDTYLS